MLVLDEKAYYKAWSDHVMSTIKGGLDQMLDGNAVGVYSSMD
jgi:hypothetical protein